MSDSKDTPPMTPLEIAEAELRTARQASRDASRAATTEPMRPPTIGSSATPDTEVSVLASEPPWEPMISTVVTTTSPPKPGWRTSEFWLQSAAFVLTALFASGALTTSPELAIAGCAAAMLGAVGYTVSRTLLKARS